MDSLIVNAVSCDHVDAFAAVMGARRGANRPELAPLASVTPALSVPAGTIALIRVADAAADGGAALTELVNARASFLRITFMIVEGKYAGELAVFTLSLDPETPRHVQLSRSCLVWMARLKVLCSSRISKTSSRVASSKSRARKQLALTTTQHLLSLPSAIFVGECVHVERN